MKKMLFYLTLILLLCSCSNKIIKLQETFNYDNCKIEKKLSNGTISYIEYDSDTIKFYEESNGKSVLELYYQVSESNTLAYFKGSDYNYFIDSNMFFNDNTWYYTTCKSSNINMGFMDDGVWNYPTKDNYSDYLSYLILSYVFFTPNKSIVETLGYYENIYSTGKYLEYNKNDTLINNLYLEYSNELEFHKSNSKFTSSSSNIYGIDLDWKMNLKNNKINNLNITDSKNTVNTEISFTDIEELYITIDNPISVIPKINKIDYSISNINYFNISNSIMNDSLILIDSLNKLNEYNITHNYTNEFFDNSSLLLIQFQQASSETNIKLDDLCIINDKYLCPIISLDSNEVNTDDFLYDLFIVEISNDLLSEVVVGDIFVENNINPNLGSAYHQKLIS